MRTGWAFATMAAMGCAACTPAANAPENVRMTVEPPKDGATFDEEVAWLRKFGHIEVLAAPNGARVAVSPDWQARVMTSAVAPDAPSLGYVNHAFIASKKTATAFDNYGGEDRFWLGPEGGQFGLYFAPGAPFTFDAWQTPHEMQEGTWERVSSAPLTFTRTMHVTNWSGARFAVKVTRAIKLLSAADVAALLHAEIPGGVSWVGFETENTVENVGAEAWSKSTGLLSAWILGMYMPSPDMRVFVPFAPGEGPIVNDKYFDPVPPSRLAVHEDRGFLVFTCDGKQRGKIGIPPSRAKETLGSYSASAKLLTVVAYTKRPEMTDYVNSTWKRQEHPFGGDVVNSYNDGPVKPGGESLGGFYEMETSSPALALAPGQRATHAHRTFHFTGDPAALDAIAKASVGVSLNDVAVR